MKRAVKMIALGALVAGIPIIIIEGPNPFMVTWLCSISGAALGAYAHDFYVARCAKK